MKTDFMLFEDGSNYYQKNADYPFQEEAFK
jgi:hypothetical protein